MKAFYSKFSRCASWSFGSRKQEADHARLKLVHHTGGLGGVNIFTYS